MRCNSGTRERLQRPFSNFSGDTKNCFTLKIEYLLTQIENWNCRGDVSWQVGHIFIHLFHICSEKWSSKHCLCTLSCQKCGTEKDPNDLLCTVCVLFCATAVAQKRKLLLHLWSKTFTFMTWWVSVKTKSMPLYILSPKLGKSTFCSYGRKGHSLMPLLYR